MEAYSYYIGNLANKIEQQVLNGNDITTEFIQEVYSQKHLFGRILNELLKDSGKTVDFYEYRYMPPAGLYRTDIGYLGTGEFGPEGIEQ